MPMVPPHEYASKILVKERVVLHDKEAVVVLLLDGHGLKNGVRALSAICCRVELADGPFSVSQLPTSSPVMPLWRKHHPIHL